MPQSKRNNTIFDRLNNSQNKIYTISTNGGNLINIEYFKICQRTKMHREGGDHLSA
jgi:hypothetical protein